MDSNKDFVRIDEVFQKLRQTPYSEANSEAAWSRMKGLLDEEMPVHPKNIPLVKRKYFYPLLLLLASAGISGTVWGYKSLSASKNAIVVANSSTKSSTNSSNKQPSSNQNHNVTLVASSTSSQNSNQLSPGEAINVASLSAAVEEIEIKNKGQKPFAPNTLHPSKKRNNTNKNNIATTANATVERNHHTTNNTNTVVSNTDIANTNPLQQTKVLHPDIINNEPAYAIINRNIKPLYVISSKDGLALNPFIAPIVKHNVSADNTSNFSLDSEENGNVIPNNNSNTIANNNRATNDNLTGEGNNNITSDRLSFDTQPKLAMQSSSNDISIPENERVLDGQKFIKDEDGQWYKETKRAIPIVNKIKTKDKETNTDIVTEVGNSTMIVLDRLPADEVEIVKLTALDKAKITTTTVEINNYSALSKSTNSFSNLKILNENKVKTINSGVSQNFNNNLKALRDDIAKFFQNSDKLQAAINFGGLFTPAGTGGYGFNVGLGGTYLLSERVHLTLEARYVHKSFTNFYIEDVNKEYTVTQNGSIFNGTEKITNQEYLISGLSMFEMPLYITYNVGERLSLFGGIQFAYAAPIKWNASTNIAVNENYANTTQPIDKAFRINDKTDFSAQTGFGYMFGIGFDVSKKMSLDFRVNQNFKNNSSAGISNSVNNIFTTPTFNINIGFWFGKKEKIYYLSNR